MPSCVCDDVCGCNGEKGGASGDECGCDRALDDPLECEFEECGDA